MLPLQGIRVLDLTRLLPGALATLYLADFGADVIKIEQPGIGDYARHLFTKEGENPVFTATNRGKRSIAIDLKREEGREAFTSLIRSADVLIESFRPQVMGRLGLGYETLSTENSRLIYVALTGYGQNGPMRNAAGHDINYMAMSGALDLIGLREQAPVVPGVQIADIAGGGMQAALGVLLALVGRAKTGRGQFIDVSMTRGAANLIALPLAQHEAGLKPGRGEGILAGEYACYNVYRCHNDRWLAVGALEPKFWSAFCNAVGHPDWIVDHYTPGKRQIELRQELAEMFAQFDAAHWLALLSPSDACVTLVRTVSEAASCDWLNVDQPAPTLSETPARPGKRVPALGEHTWEVLLESGMPESEIEALMRLGVVA